ncbi:MAG TPA: hypothetical protein VN231_12355 [Allosphingosinicella sp.]|nr:hypothetical protein [Allosphingosinicella sp.]
MKALFLAIAAAVAAYAVEPAAPAPEPDLAAVRAAAERFRDVNVALAAGYVPAPGAMCETAEGMGRPASLGAMGVHYFRPDRLGISGPPDPRVDGTGTHTDFLDPAVLIYEPQPDGSMELVAVENLVFERAWRAAGNNAPPTFHGRPYEHMADDPATPIDEAHHFEPHFDRHVWVFRDNPNGVFAPFNPNVRCPAPAQGSGHAH